MLEISGRSHKEITDFDRKLRTQEYNASGSEAMLILLYLLPPNIGCMLEVVNIEPFQGPIRPFLVLVSTQRQHAGHRGNGCIYRWSDVLWSYHWYNKQCRDYLVSFVTRIDT